MVRTNELGQRRSHAEDRSTVERLSVDPRFLHVSWRFQVGIDEPPVALSGGRSGGRRLLPASESEQLHFAGPLGGNDHAERGARSARRSHGPEEYDSGFLHQRDRRFVPAAALTLELRLNFQSAAESISLGAVGLRMAASCVAFRRTIGQLHQRAVGDRRHVGRDRIYYQPD